MEEMSAALLSAIEKERMEKVAVVRRQVIASHTRTEIVKPTAIEISFDKETMLPMLARVWYFDKEVYQNLVTQCRIRKAEYDQFKEHFKDKIYSYYDYALHMD